MVDAPAEMGFKHGNKRYIYEQPHRDAYPGANKHPRPTIFLDDETWCNSRHGRTHTYGWTVSDGKGGFNGKGPRLMVVYAGGEAGWTSNSFSDQNRRVVTTYSESESAVHKYSSRIIDCARQCLLSQRKSLRVVVSLRCNSLRIRS